MHKFCIISSANVAFAVAILMYLIGFAYRFDAATVHTRSRVILALNSVLWHMKLFGFLSVHPKIGKFILLLSMWQCINSMFENVLGPFIGK